MRYTYRECRTVCGEYLDVDIFPVMQASRANAKRGKRFRPTSEIMQRYNQRKRNTRLERLVLTNFVGNGLFFNPSWDNNNLPANEKAARRDIINFIRRLKNYRKRHGLPELKYIYKIECGKRSGRLHSHMILNCCDMPVGMLDEIWGMGFCYSSRIKCDANGCPGLAKYFCKNENEAAESANSPCGTVGYSWVPSRNLKKPKEIKRDGKISKRQAVSMCTGKTAPKSILEAINPGYELSTSRCIYNEVNGGYYINARMRLRSKTAGKVKQCRQVKKK